MKGKLIVIEGTDCSGKEMQAKQLMKRLEQDGYETVYFSFPQYETPSGKIVGGPYLGKPKIGEGWFPEGAPAVDPKVSCLYYAADRRYNIPKVLDYLKQGKIVLLDRYTYSNMGHQAGKLATKEERMQMFDWIAKLEFDLLALPKPDIKVFLHMPYEYACLLKKGRFEKPDQLEADANHLKHAEQTYLELAEAYQFKTIKCHHSDQVRSIDDINDELYIYVKSYFA